MAGVEIVTTTTAARREGRWARLVENRHVLGAVMVGPAVLLLALFLAYPFALGAWLSLTDATIGTPGRFVGLANFAYLLDDAVFRLVVFNTALYAGVAVLFKLALGFLLALLVNREFAGKRIVRAVMLLPWIVPTSLSALVFYWLYDGTFSVLTWMLKQMGLVDGFINYLGDPTLARASLIAANVWRGIPFFAIGLLAGLQTVSPTLYEAADIDGAGPWQKFWAITWPLLLPLTAVVTVFSTIMTVGDFQLVWIITKGGPANATHLLGTLAYQRAIQGGYIGEGAAISGFMLPVLLASVAVAYHYLRRE
ncbi:MAG: sugar ABC transporter permease [Armatimonadota bacterium]|nr:sugar ABC transporter permease [Armatimonadota bacterium]MDR7484713.1 sugar ABC transporter permease [Armatimonadota bacterium]MDR7531828.1 sugar ABC transporter permease [Armatimonadota bacterium]MDR7534827.1 sugar ABC transporter permease [Armatimonadota bacterium]